MLKYDFEASVGHWLCSAHHEFMVAFRDRLAPYNITYRQAEILFWLAYEGPLSQAELANRMMIEPPSLVGTLDRMEASGLLARKPCPEDRRKNLVQPLPAAEKVWQQIASCAREVRAQAMEGFTAQEMVTLKELLTKLRDNFAVLEPVESVS